MDFDFEPIEEVSFDDEENEDIIETEETTDEYEDISSSSLESEEEFDIMSMGKKKKRNKLRIVLNTVISVVLAISLLLTAGGIFYLNIEDKTVTKNNDVFVPPYASASEDVTYFLVVGCDWTETKQTDVIVVVCMDHKKNKVSMLQIPRDTYINTGNKINSAYAMAPEGKRINALCQVLSNELCIPIDQYVMFSIEAAVKVVNALGGVEMKLSSPIRIEDPLKFGKYYYLEPDANGMVNLSGRDAIGFMRKRFGNEEGYETGSDIGRIKQQRKFYSALFKKLTQMTPAQVAKIASECMNEVQTSLTYNDAVSYAVEVMKMDIKNIHIFGLPGQGADYYGGSYYSIHKDEYVEMFNKHFNPYGKKITVEDAQMTELHTMNGDQYYQWLTNEDSTLEDY